MSLLAPARGMSTLPAKGGFSRPSSIRSAGSHRGLSSRWSLAYSSCWAGFSFSTSCFTIPIHPIIIYMILSFVNLKRYLVNWNARRRLLGLRLLAPPKTFAGIAWVLRPHSERSERGGSSHARGKRPPAVEINGFYNTYTNRSALHLGCKWGKNFWNVLLALKLSDHKNLIGKFKLRLYRIHIKIVFSYIAINTPYTYFLFLCFLLQFAKFIHIFIIRRINSYTGQSLFQ